MGYKGQVLRGEKWATLMTEEQLTKEPAYSSKLKDIEVYKESQAKVEAKLEDKSKGKK